MGADALEHEKLGTQTAMLIGGIGGLCRLLRRRIAQHRLVLAERGQHLWGAVHDVDRPTTPLDLREGATFELADVELDGTAQRLRTRARVEGRHEGNGSGDDACAAGDESGDSQEMSPSETGALSHGAPLDQRGQASGSLPQTTVISDPKWASHVVRCASRVGTFSKHLIIHSAETA